MNTELTLSIAAGITIMLIPILLIARDKSQIRKELRKRGWEVLEIRWFHWDNFGENRGEPTRYDVRFKNQNGYRRNMTVIKEGFRKLDFSDAPTNE